MVSDYIIYKDLCKPRFIDWYLHWFVIYHFCKPVDIKIITGIFLIGKYRQSIIQSIDKSLH